MIFSGETEFCEQLKVNSSKLKAKDGGSSLDYRPPVNRYDKKVPAIRRMGFGHFPLFLSPIFMQHTTIDLFFLLLQLGIGTRESLHLETPLPESSWKELLTLARKQAVTGIVMDGILKLPTEYLPPAPIKLKGIQQLLRIEQLNRRLNGEAVQVSEFLQTEGYA